MPSANLQSVIKNILTGNGAPVTTTPPATGAGDPTQAASLGSPFDAILMLEELAAAAQPLAPDETVGATGIDTGAAELDLEAGDIEASDDTKDGEDNIEDGDDPLAFLVGLLSMAPPPATPPGGTGEGEGEGEGDAAAGGSSAHAIGRGHGGTLSAALPLPGAPEASGTPTPDDSPTNSLNQPASPKADGDAAAAARLLAAQVAVTGTEASKTDEPTMSSRATDLLAHAARGAAAADAPAPAHVATHVRDPRWAEDFSNRIAMLVTQKESVASLSLTPVDLGPVDVSITVKDSQATIHFGAAQADTRQLIESSIPKLRELLAAQGFNLTDASVSQQFRGQTRKNESPSIPRPSGVDEVTPVTVKRVVTNGLLDTYA